MSEEQKYFAVGGTFNILTEFTQNYILKNMGFRNYNIRNPNFDTLGYVVAIANLKDTHDRSAPTDYHWKILKCRMIIFSNSSVLACPDKSDVKQVHIIFKQDSDAYDKLNLSFAKFSLKQNGSIKRPTPEIFETCFEYTMTAKIAPIWNTLGYFYLINNRDFLTCNTPQDALEYHITCTETITTLKLKAVRIHIFSSRDKYEPGEWIRVLPSLNKATIEDSCDGLPDYGHFRSYKDLRRHWKNIHGYRIPEEACNSYYTVRFWRGEPLLYPKVCLFGDFPIITPVPKNLQITIVGNFFECLKQKFTNLLGEQLIIENEDNIQEATIKFPNTQEVSLCTPTPKRRRLF